ncbi:MAG: hypothetical protein FWD70_00160 [Desulfuromonadales bacterium]|nr:hypothetical protein [Desulfuromonadales bacterium]
MATINDLVLVHIDNKPGFYARIEDITPDMKKGWWQVRLLVLTFPLQVYTWILDEDQIDGGDFTMGGTPVQIEKLVPPPTDEKPVPSSQNENSKNKTGSHQKVVSLAERRKSNEKSEE